jgi:hypothetical protein
LILATAPGAARSAEPALLFHVSGDKGLVADVAGGDPIPNFADKVTPIADGRSGKGLHAEDDGVVSWNAPGNILAQRGTLSFFWRSGYPVGAAPFVIFRVGYADHTSWDMAFLRIDWNGHGFDAFVTDNGLARTRVSFRLDKPPAADAWTHLAFTWDETRGVQLFVDGRLVASKEAKAVYDAGLDQFGVAGRVIAPHQVQSRYNFTRGGDLDELKVYDRPLDATGIAALARDETPLAEAPVATLDDPGTHAAWRLRHGWNRDDDPPPYLADASTAIRKVEFADAKDIKEWMWKATDGIPETTWPGVYNRSRLPGRNDYFQLPDWNVYVDGGKALTLTLPNEPVNRIEIQGPAYGGLSWAAKASDKGVAVGSRPKDQARTVSSLARPLTGGVLTFTNIAQETPIQEIWAYNVTAGQEPKDAFKMSYTVRADVAPDYLNLATLNAYIAGRHPVGERATVVALPEGAPSRKRPASDLMAKGLPIVHVLIPSGFGDAPPAQALARNWAYGWENARDGLDGVAIDLPALPGAGGANGLIPLNIQVKDPIWPGRNMIDVSVSVKPGEPRTVWLDLRDRILTADSLYLTLAADSADFGPRALDGTRIRLVLKDRDQAKVEHITDRLNQVKDNWAFLVEEHTTSKRQGLYRRLYADITDLLRVDPDNAIGREYWADITYGSQGWPAFDQPKPPPGAPLWAFRQVEDLKRVAQFANWWIDERQSDYGDFGGGISDDTDLTQQWPGLALMGVEPDKITRSLNRLTDAVYRNGMFTNGLSTIVTDELHAYEEGINSNSEAMYVEYGDPLAVERLFTTVKALPRVIERNPAGHVHFNTNWYSGALSYREGPWEWQKPYSFGVVHPAILIGDYNNDPTSRGLVLGLADGYLAHGRKDADGQPSWPNEINWRTDAERGGTLLQGSGSGGPFQIFWTAYRWTGDAKYLAPIQWRIGKSGLKSLNDINDDALSLLHLGAQNRDAVLKAAAKGGAADRFAAWRLTGDKRYLEDLYADEIQSASQHMYMHTEGHWWSDRVEIPSDLLQRSRLGGVANKRGQMLPGHLVSWRFEGGADGRDVAILIKDGEATRFKVVAYNLSDRPVVATMTGWGVAPGTWTARQGVDTDGDDAIDGAGETRDLAFERTRSLTLTLPPRQTTILDMARTAAGDDPARRADLGLGRGDVAVAGSTVTAKVHSLGAQDAAAARVELVDAAGKVLDSAAVPPLKAPTDLLPKTLSVKLKIPAGAKASGLRVRIVTHQPQITALNDEVVLP